MWVKATSVEQFKPGVKFRRYFLYPERRVAYTGVFVENENDGKRKWLCESHGAYSNVPIGETSTVDSYTSTDVYDIWMADAMEEFLNKLFAVLTREWVNDKYCNTGIQDLFNEIIVQRMRGDRCVEGLKADIVCWLEENYSIEEYASQLDELGIVYEKPMKIVVMLPDALTGFDADDFREWLVDYCGDHTYVLDIQRGQ